MKTKIMMMLIASAAVMTACSSDDPFENAYNYMDPGMLGPGGDMMTGGAEAHHHPALHEEDGRTATRLFHADSPFLYHQSHEDHGGQQEPCHHGC